MKVTRSASSRAFSALARAAQAFSSPRLNIRPPSWERPSRPEIPLGSNGGGDPAARTQRRAKGAEPDKHQRPGGRFGDLGEAQDGRLRRIVDGRRAQRKGVVEDRLSAGRHAAGELVEKGQGEFDSDLSSLGAWPTRRQGITAWPHNAVWD